MSWFDLGGESLKAGIKSFVVIVSVSATLAYFARQRRKKRLPADFGKLQFPPVFAPLGFVATAMFFGIAGWIAWENHNNIYQNLLVTTLLASALCFGFVTRYFMSQKHQAHEDFLDYNNLFGNPRRIKWADLKQVKYSKSGQCFQLKTFDGISVRIEAMLLGIPDFATLLLAKAPPQAIDPETLAVLRKASAGNPP